MAKSKFWLKHKALIGQICTSTCLVGASAGIIFGVSAGTFKITYMTMNDADARLAAANSSFAYYSQDIGSQWNMDISLDSHQKKVDETWWKGLHNGADMLHMNNGTDLRPGLETDVDWGGTISTNAIKKRYDYISMIIDGSTHTTMDRSFNQGLYNGVVNFIKNKTVDSVDPETENDPVGKNCAKSFKPGGDNTTEFLNIYASTAAKYKAICLAGFNHVTPLNAMGEYNEKTHRVEFKNPNYDKTGFLLIDGDVPNNQNISSVLFRADQPGFLAAISTCMYFFNNLQTYHNNYQNLAMAMYGGTPIPTVCIYMGGVERGVEFFNQFILKNGILRVEWDIPQSRYYGDGFNYLTDNEEELGLEEFDFTDLKKLIQYSKHKEEIEAQIAKARQSAAGFESKPKELVDNAISILNKLYDEYEIKLIKLGEGATHFSGNFTSGDAIGITKQYLNRGAQAIIAVAGPQTLDSAQEIQNQDSNCIVIGVDSSMEDGDFQRSFNSNKYEDATLDKDGNKSPHANDIVKFSAVKDITAVTSKFAEVCTKGLNYDVIDTHKWRHSSTPTYSEEQVIDEKYLEFSKSGDHAVLTGLEQVSLPTKKTVLVIPDSVKIGEEVLNVTEIAAGAFNDTNSKQITRVNFNKHSLDIGENAFKDCSKLQTLDFSANTEKFSYTFGTNAFALNTTKTKNGYLMFTSAPDVSTTIKDSLTEKLVESGLNSEWFIDEPDPEKSTCGVGYKTCGNIENGLISISKSGWVPFIQAMSHAYFWSDISGVSNFSFRDAWDRAAQTYCAQHLDEIPAEDREMFKDQVYDYNKLNTFNLKSPIYKYYDHTMKILAIAMGGEDYKFEFSPAMTIAKDPETGKFYKPTTTSYMTILDWLKLNMYLCF